MCGTFIVHRTQIAGKSKITSTTGAKYYGKEVMTSSELLIMMKVLEKSCHFILNFFTQAMLIDDANNFSHYDKAVGKSHAHIRYNVNISGRLLFYEINRRVKAYFTHLSSYGCMLNTKK